MRKFYLGILLGVLLVFISACGSSSSSSSSGTITIGAQTYTETKILAEMYKALIEQETDLKVNVKPDLATSPIIIEGMVDGDIDLSTHYTGTAITSYTEIENPQDPEATIQQAIDFFGSEDFNFEVLDPLGFANTYVITVSEELANTHNLQKVSDLSPIASDLRAGFDTSWLERENDGYPAFAEMYGFEFGNINPMEVGLVYDGLKNGEVDTVLAYSTDPRIVSYNLYMLEDDKNFFPPYDALPFIRKETLEAYPEIKDALAPLFGHFDELTMAELNGKVDIDGQEIQDVAVEYLKSQDLLK